MAAPATPGAPSPLGLPKENQRKGLCLEVFPGASGPLVDVHVFELDEEGRNRCGVPYPFGSVNGVGMILHSQVRCIGPEWMFKLKTAYPRTAKSPGNLRPLELDIRSLLISPHEGSPSYVTVGSE